MTIKDQPPTATHRSRSFQEGSSSNQPDSIGGTVENDNFYSVHDTAAPPPYYQAAEHAGPSSRPETDRNSLEELNPTPISHSVDEDDEERRPLLSSRSRKKRKRRIPFSVALILFATLASIITWIIARRIKDEEDDVYIVSLASVTSSLLSPALLSSRAEQILTLPRYPLEAGSITRSETWKTNLQRQLVNSTNHGQRQERARVVYVLRICSSYLFQSFTLFPF